MDLKTHYSSYKRSFQSTMLNNYSEYLKKTSCEVYGTKFGRVVALVKAIEVRISSHDEEGYLQSLRTHQQIMQDTFREISLDHLSFGGLTSVPEYTASDWGKALDTFGMIVFRYSPCPGLKIKYLEGHTITILPSYANNKHLWDGVTSCFDAQEVRWLDNLKRAGTLVEVERFIDSKKNHPNTKLNPSKGEILIPIEDLNKDIVRDWVLPL